MSMHGKVYVRPGGGESRTKQAMQDECNINLIMARFEKTGLITHLAQGAPSFADVSELTGYRSAIENVRLVQEYFLGLPAKVRARFDHDAATFMDYLESDATPDELRELGLDALGDRRAPALDRRVTDVEEPPKAEFEPSEVPNTLPT